MRVRQAAGAFFSELENFTDAMDRAMDAAQATRAQLGVVLFCVHWLLRSNHHNLHYRHLHLLLALQHLADRDADADAVTLLRRVMGGEHVAALARLLQAFAVEKLQKDRCRYFDVLLYQVAFEASGELEAEASSLPIHRRRSNLLRYLYQCTEVSSLIQFSGS